MDLTATDLSRLRRRKLVAEMFMLGCGILAFGWIGAALVLVLRDADLRQQMLCIFWYLSLWLAIVPLCAFLACWCWRWILARKISEITK